MNTYILVPTSTTAIAIVDHRSCARQGIDQIPTVHLGPAASRMEKKGIRTERGDINRAIEITNREWRQLKARLSKLGKWVSEWTPMRTLGMVVKIETWGCL